MNDDIVLALFIEDNPVIPYSDDEEMLHNYAEFIGAKEYGIQEMKYSDLSNYCEEHDLLCSELTELKSGTVITEDEFDMVSSTLEEDIHLLVRYLKYIKRNIKYIKGKSSKKLSTAITEFLKERIPCSDYVVDPDTTTDRIIERVKLTKYAKHALCYDKKK